MEVKVKEDSKNRATIEIKGESHTLCNALKNELWNDSHIKVAGYNKEHPLKDSIKFIIETDGKETPKKALAEAAKRLKKRSDDFKSAFAKIK